MLNILPDSYLKYNLVEYRRREESKLEKKCTRCLRKLSIDKFYDRKRGGKVFKHSVCIECVIFRAVIDQRKRRSRAKNETAKG